MRLTNEFASALVILVWLCIVGVTVAQSSAGQGGTSTSGETTQIQPRAPRCTSELFQEAAAASNQPDATIDSTSGAQLMYIKRGQLCDADMDCGDRGLQTTLSIALATSGEGTSQGVCAKIEITNAPPPVSGCEQVYDAPEGQLTNLLESPLYVGITTTRSFVYYPLQPVDKVNSVPYCYAQFNDTTTSGACTFTTCAQATLVSPTSTNDDQCDAAYIDSTWGDNKYASIIMEKCGALADSPQDIIKQDKSACYESCCAQCNSAVQDTTYRRWPFGPQCQVFRVGAPQLRIFGGLVVSLSPDLTDGEEIRFQTPRTNAAGQQAYNGGLPQRAEILSASRKVRMLVNQQARGPSALRRIDGYVVICSGTVQQTVRGTCDMGAPNPYVQTPQPNQCLSQYRPFVSDSIPLVAPPNAAPDELGTGTVPTFNSLDDIGISGKCSWYYVPQDRAQNVLNMPNSASFANRPISQLTQVLWPSLSADAEGGTNCPGGSTDAEYFDKYIGVPGWQLDPDTMQPLVTSICQMSHALNNYSQVYKTQYALSLNGPLAKEQSAPEPPWLLPEFDIIRPNWWLHDQSLVFDLGLSYPQRTALELLVQLSDEEFIPRELTNDLFAVAAEQSSCGAVVGNGTGGVQIAVKGLYITSSTEEVPQYMMINCTTALNATVRLFLPNGTAVNNQTQILPFTALTNVVTLAHTLNMSFTPQAEYSPLTAPYVQCKVQLLDNELVPYGALTVIGCRTTLGNASLAVEYGDPHDLGGSTTALYIALGVAGALVIIVAVVLVFVYGVFRKDPETREVIARNLGD